MYNELNKVNKGAFLLSDFLYKIKNILNKSFKNEQYWIKGELSDWRKVSENYYGELIEHDKKKSQSLAKIRINMWKNNGQKIVIKFSKITGEDIKVGMKILVLVTVNFHQNFGLSLNILDLEPKFTLGDRITRKNEIIENLTKLKIINKNRILSKPKEFTNVAIISSKNAAGLGDFFPEAKLLKKNNLCQFTIYHTYMQGKECAHSITKQLRKINKILTFKEHKYDAIVLIRGGGSQSDLDWLNNFDISHQVCETTIPILIGVGHERDETILDIIATKSFDTPSKVIHHIINTIINNTKQAKKNFQSLKMTSQFYIKKNLQYLNNYTKYIKTIIENITNKQKIHLSNNYKQICKCAKQKIIEINIIITNTKEKLKYFTAIIIKNSSNDTKNIIIKSANYLKNILENQKIKLNNYKQNTHFYTNNIIIISKKNIKDIYQNIINKSINPTLKRGFAITKSQNKYITSLKNAKRCKYLIINYYDGKIKTEVKI